MRSPCRLKLHLRGPAVWYNDMYSYNTTSRTWAALKASGILPPERGACGFAWADGLLYIFGGFGTGTG